MPPNDENMKFIVDKVKHQEMFDFYNLNYENYIEPQSAYYAVRRNGITYHVFDAARIPLGRMANSAARFLMGKHKPNYDPKKVLINGDKIIVVNGGNVKVHGKKYLTKIYYHHTGYSGGLKEILMMDLMRRDPEQLVKRAIKGMMPRNKTRPKLLEKITVHRGQYHNHQSQKLPQFINQPLPDPNLLFGFPKTEEDFKNATVIFEKDPNNLPIEFKDSPRDLDPALYYPKSHLALDYKKDNRNNRIEKQIQDHKKKLKRYKR